MGSVVWVVMTFGALWAVVEFVRFFMKPHPDARLKNDPEWLAAREKYERVQEKGERWYREQGDIGAADETKKHLEEHRAETKRIMKK